MFKAFNLLMSRFGSVIFLSQTLVTGCLVKLGFQTSRSLLGYQIKVNESLAGYTTNTPNLHFKKV